MGKELPYFRLYAATLLSQIIVSQESHETTSARLRLWCAACQGYKGGYRDVPSGYVPDDPDWLSKMAGVSLATWGGIGGAITMGWVHEPGLKRYKIKRLVEQSRERADFVKYGKQGADKRWKHSPPNAVTAICPTTTSISSSPTTTTATSGKKTKSSEPIAVAGFPCVGRANQPKTWDLTEPHLTELQEAYPKIDARSQAGEARQWCRDNPSDRKTHRGMKRFINSWMQRNQNRGGSHGGNHGRPKTEHPSRDGFSEYADEQGFPGFDETPTDHGPALEAGKRVPGPSET